MVAIPKLIKPVGVPKSYRPIYLLCVFYKIIKRLIYVSVEPIIDPLLLREQAEFWRKKSTMDQVILLTENIEDFWSICLSDSGIYFMVYGILALHVMLHKMLQYLAIHVIWHTLYSILALNVSYLRLLPDNYIERMIIKLVQNRSFTLTTGDSKQSRIRHLRNGVAQGSFWGPFLFNLFIFTSTSALHNFVKVYLNRQFSIVALLWKLKGFWET